MPLTVSNIPRSMSAPMIRNARCSAAIAALSSRSCPALASSWSASESARRTVSGARRRYSSAKSGKRRASLTSSRRNGSTGPRRTADARRRAMRGISRFASCMRPVSAASSAEKASAIPMATRIVRGRAPPCRERRCTPCVWRRRPRGRCRRHSPCRSRVAGRPSPRRTKSLRGNARCADRRRYSPSAPP